MWKRYKKQIGGAATVTLMGVLLFFYGLADEDIGSFVRTVGLLVVVAGAIGLGSLWSASRRVTRITRETVAEWTAEDGSRVALYKRAVLADGLLNDFSTPGVRVLSRVYAYGLLTIEYSYRARGGEKIERIVLPVPGEADEAVRRYVDDNHANHG